MRHFLAIAFAVTALATSALTASARDAEKLDPNQPKLINADRMFGLEVVLDDADRGLIATGKEVPEIARRCSFQKNSKFFYREVTADTLVLSCTQTMDFIEHPNKKPTVTTLTYTFRDQRSHILLETVTTNHGYTFTPVEIEKLIKLSDED
ncbi:MAG: hypothetical protein GY844_23675 [Bradyrhizobium sp.]|nr:hypothetical protein [Bradyrhizobium sp.]